MHVSRWTYGANCHASRPSDPINVIFESGIPLSDVLDHLDNMGWQSPRAASDLYLECPGVTQQSEQRILGIGSLVRYHVRLWDTTGNQGASVVLAAAHYEKDSLKGGHKVLSFEKAEQEIATTCGWPSGQWTVTASSHDLQNAISRSTKAWNDGYATVVRP